MINISKLLEEHLLFLSDLMKNLQPRFVLVGSTQEGSRLGVGNEADLTLHFLAWRQCPPFKIIKDAFHLYKADTCPKWMDTFFNDDNQFMLEIFILQICLDVEQSLDKIYRCKQNPERLSRQQTNKDYVKKSCQNCMSGNAFDNTWFIQCVDCTVCVSRTKMGVCLQFEWRHENIDKPVFCSIDLVPVYNIESEETKRVIRLSNESMLSRSHPPAWYNNLKNFLKEDRVVEELWSEGETVDKVLLKSLGNGNYFIRGGQRLKTDVLCGNKRLLGAYVLIKAIKSYLEIEDLSNFMIKKMLMGPTFVELASTTRQPAPSGPGIVDSSGAPVAELPLNRQATCDADLLQDILAHVKLKMYFEPYIDLTNMQVIRLKDMGRRSNSSSSEAHEEEYLMEDSE